MKDKKNKKLIIFFINKNKTKCLKINLMTFINICQNMPLVLYQWELLINLYINNL